MMFDWRELASVVGEVPSKLSGQKTRSAVFLFVISSFH